MQENHAQGDRSFPRENAVDFAKKTVYTMDNPYLTRDQKVEVETWFQAPCFVSRAALVATCLLWHSGYLSGWEAFLWAAASGVVIVILFRIIYLRWLAILIGFTIGFPWISSLIYLSFAIYLVLQDSWGPAALLGLNTLLGGIPSGLLGLLAVTILHGSRMHPKYAFAERHLGVKIT